MLSVLYQDRDLLIVDKPAGIPVVPGRNGGPSIAGEVGLLICHRLDTDTSGVLALAKTAAGQRLVNMAFMERRVEKVYRAVCIGHPSATSGTVNLPLGDWHRGRVAIGRGKAATTEWSVAAQLEDRVWVDARPLTGRTHQIRAHLTAVGLPLVGDDAYGGPTGPRVMLHAYRLVLPWPRREDRLEITAPLPPGFEPPG